MFLSQDIHSPKRIHPDEFVMRFPVCLLTETSPDLCGTDIHGAQRINPYKICDLTFPAALPLGQSISSSETSALQDKVVI